MTTQTSLFNETDLVYAYTRKQAIEDGYQVALTDDIEPGIVKMARQLYKHPIFLTGGVFDLVQKAVDNTRWLNDWKGVMWDILYMSQVYKRDLSPSTVETLVRINGAGRQKNYRFILQVGPMDIDDPTPVITVMLPGEE